MRTLAYTFDTTESELLHEVIVVDDMSDVSRAARPIVYSFAAMYIQYVNRNQFR